MWHVHDQDGTTRQRDHSAAAFRSWLAEPPTWPAAGPRRRALRAEQWHPAIVPHEGPDTPVFAEISALGDEVRRREPVTVSAATALDDPRPSLPRTATPTGTETGFRY